MPQLSVLEYTRLIENFCVSDERPLDGFEQGLDGRFVPVFRSSRNEAAIGWGLAAYRAVVFAVTDAFVAGVEAIRELAPSVPEGAGANFGRDDSAAAVDALLTTFFNDPEPDEAAAWGTFPVETDATGAFQAPWARPYRWGDVARVLVFGYTRLDSTLWVAAARRRTVPLCLRCFDLACRLRERATWLRRKLRSLLAKVSAK